MFLKSILLNVVHEIYNIYLQSQLLNTIRNAALYRRRDVLYELLPLMFQKLHIVDPLKAKDDDFRH